MEAFFDFEKPIVNLEKKLQDLRELAKQEGVDFSQEITLLEAKVNTLIDETYSRLSPWQKVQLSRHPNRPYTRDYVDAIFTDFMELQGDRTFGDDQAILGGVATWKVSSGESIPVMILGHQKGRTTKQKMERNFGMAKPEGYRKAMRLMELANRCRMPLITFIDTPGAYPGLDAEQRGQSQAIAESIQLMFGLTVPVIAIVIGEGGSGGALAIGVADRVLMSEYSVYSVISPESCASILWSDSSLAERASEKLKMSPTELLRMGVIDGVIPEPKGGAHRDWTKTFENLQGALKQHLEPLIVDWLATANASPNAPDSTLETRAIAAQGPAPSKNGKTKTKKGVLKKGAKTALKKLSGKALKGVASTDEAPHAPQANGARNLLAARQAWIERRIAKFRKMGGFALAHAPASGLTEESSQA